MHICYKATRRDTFRVRPFFSSSALRNNKWVFLTGFPSKMNVEKIKIKRSPTNCRSPSHIIQWQLIFIRHLRLCESGYISRYTRTSRPVCRPFCDLIAAISDHELCTHVDAHPPRSLKNDYRFKLKPVYSFVSNQSDIFSVRNKRGVQADGERALRPRRRLFILNCPNRNLELNLMTGLKEKWGYKYFTSVINGC